MTDVTLWWTPQLTIRRGQVKRDSLAGMMSDTTSRDLITSPNDKSDLPEADEVNAIIRAAPSPKAKLLMLEQWRAGLRVSEALDLEVAFLLQTPEPESDSPETGAGLSLSIVQVQIPIN